MRWISVKTAMPDKSGDYLVWSDYGQFGTQIVVPYSEKHKAWNTYDSFDEQADQEPWKHISHWAKITTPKGMKA